MDVDCAASERRRTAVASGEDHAGRDSREKSEAEVAKGYE